MFMFFSRGLVAVWPSWLPKAEVISFCSEGAFWP